MRIVQLLIVGALVLLANAAVAQPAANKPPLEFNYGIPNADHVTVLIFVDQEISNPGTGGSDPQKGLDQPRVTMKMVRQGGRWLVDEVNISSLSNNG